MISIKSRLFRTAARTAVIVFFTAAVTQGDVVRLKSGGTVEGIITRIHNGVVCLNVGFGTTFVDSVDILSITRSDAQENKALNKEWTDRGAVRNDAANPGLLVIIDKLRGLRALRISAINRQRQLDRLDAEIDSLERAFCEKADGYQAISSDFSGFAQKDYDEQYRLVGQAHQFNSSIISIQKDIAGKKNDIKRGNPALPEYLDSVENIEKAFRVFKKTCTKKILCDNREVLGSIENDFCRYKSEFRTAVTDATFIQDDQIIVPVSINGKAKVFLLFDTGASTVTLSRALADRLGIDWRSGIKVTASLADGQTVAGHSVLLRSVAVGDFPAAGVRAVVLEKPPVDGVDGLLGMSYLQRFILRIDPVNKKFVLTRIIVK